MEPITVGAITFPSETLQQILDAHHGKTFDEEAMAAWICEHWNDLGLQNPGGTPDELKAIKREIASQAAPQILNQAFFISRKIDLPMAWWGETNKKWSLGVEAIQAGPYGDGSQAAPR